MRIISFGDLLVDYYFSNNLLLGISGGKSNANILANLSNHFNTAFLGVVGNDIQGAVAYDSLKKLGVDMKGVEIIPSKTNKVFINSKSSTMSCPYCGRDLNYAEPKFDVKKVLLEIKEDDLVIIDSFDEKTVEVIKNCQNRLLIMINNLEDLLYMSLDEIEELLKGRAEIININGKVYDTLRKKFQMDAYDFYKVLEPKVLIISRGKNGTEIISGDDVYEKEALESVNEVETSGAIDAFFAEFIRTIIENDFQYNEKIISLAYMRACTLASFVSTNYGARTHLQPLYKISDYHECLCSDIEVNNL